MSITSIKPRWEMAGTYYTACRAMENEARYGDGPIRQEDASQTLDELYKSRIVTIDSRQVEALPYAQSDEEIVQYARAFRPPFPYTYFSLGEASLGISGDVKSQRPVRAVGSLLIEYSEKSWGCVLFVRKSDGDLMVPSEVTLNEDGTLTMSEGQGRSEAGRSFHETAIACAYERVIAVLALLDGTTDVEIVTATASRQVRRVAERTGAVIALTVVIGANSQRYQRQGEGQKIEYSHRFERRALFACITKGSKFKEDKLSSWCPRHGVRNCRREYRRSTIIGPPGKPFIPKIRVVSEDAYAPDDTKNA